MNTETLQINIESPIATVTLNRPNVLNAFNEQLVLDLQKAFKDLTEDESVRVIILTGSGKGFSAGADLTEREASCCLLYTSPSPRDRQKSRMPSSA